MLKKLYEAGCFNFQKFILDNTKSLSLNSDETMVLIKILEGYFQSKTLSSEALVLSLSLSKAKVDKALASLLERNFYEIYINYDNGVGQEYISIDGFFKKVEAVLGNHSVNIEDEMFSINQYLTKQMNRILTSKELEILTSLIEEDRYRLSDFEKSCEFLKSKGKIITLKNIAQALVVKEEPKQASAPKVIEDFFKSIK